MVIKNSGDIVTKFYNTNCYAGVNLINKCIDIGKLVDNLQIYVFHS